MLPLTAEPGQQNFVIRHARVPGRLRLHVPSLRGDPARGRSLESCLRARPEVTEAIASPLTATLLVRFAPDLPLSVVLGHVGEMLSAALPSEMPVPTAVSPVPKAAHGRAWHAGAAEDLAVEFGSSVSAGLDEQAAQDILQRVGGNRLPPTRS